jgi:hypothetical protein
MQICKERDRCTYAIIGRPKGYLGVRIYYILRRYISCVRGRLKSVLSQVIAPKVLLVAIIIFSAGYQTSDNP